MDCFRRRQLRNPKTPNADISSGSAAGTGTSPTFKSVYVGLEPVTQFEGVGFQPSRLMSETEKIPKTGDGLLFELAKIEKFFSIVVPRITHEAMPVTRKSGLFQLNSN
mgnify:CR=1 FL=1